MNWLPLTAGFTGMGLVFLLVPVILVYSRKTHVAERSADLHHTHQVPVCRLGGIALAVAFLTLNLIATLAFPERANLRETLVILATSLAMFCLWLWDDLRPMGAKKKLLGQALIASSVVCFGIDIMSFKIPFSGYIINLGSWGALITVLWLI